MYKRVVVGTDLSDTARVATDRAAALARTIGAPLVLVHAGRSGAALSSLAEAYGAEAVVRDGNPADVLISEADKEPGSLLVVGSVGMRGARRFLLGSVPNKVSHHVSTDLLIVKTDPPPPEVGEYRRILVGTDGSPTAMRAVDMASDLAKEVGARATVVCAYEPPTDEELRRYRSDPNDPVAQWGAGSETGVPEEFRWRIAAATQAEDVLDRALDHAAARGVEVDVRAEQGTPADVLINVAEAEGFDLIVVGSVGMTGTGRFMLGNVPNRVSHHAPTDILILRTQ
jgi:nucleotide-binding universal stress UspA family protein